IAHALRREAEALLIPTLGPFLAGKHQPRDNEERFALLEGCRYLNRPTALARLYAAIFAADPAQAKDLRTGHRYHAARAAALAGSGRGEDVPRLDAERKRWRQQARAWLRADLAAWDEAVTRDAATVTALREQLERWRVDPDLAGLRNAA